MPTYHAIIKPTKDAVPVERLIRAKKEARALAHVSEDTITIKVADPDTIHRLAVAGVPIEVVGDPPAASTGSAA